MSIITLQDLLLDQLRDVYSVESLLIPALSELQEMAQSSELREFLGNHLEETKRQKERLEQIATVRGDDLGGDPSKAMLGLIEGGRSHIEQTGHPATRDFLIIAHCHRIEHYEVAAYAVTVALADHLGLHVEAELLSQSLQEERAMDETLTRFASGELLGKIPPR